jgi:hypothetical protein
MRTVSSTRTPAELALAVRKAIATLHALEKDLGISAPNLTARQKQRTARYRKGGDSVIGTLSAVATQSGATVGTLPVDEMHDMLAMAKSVDELRLKLSIFDAHLSAFAFSARAAAWSTAMQYYALLQRMAKRNGNIAEALAPVTKFMSMHDPRRKRAAGKEKPKEKG